LLESPLLAIRASFSTQINALVSDLGAPDAFTREAAVARLTVLGSRAVERLIAVAASAGDPATRAAAWRTLEAIGDPRALDPALHALSGPATDPAVGAAAAGVARAFIRGARGAASVDRLTAVVLDRAQPDAVRLAALRALGDLGPAAIAPILASLAGDPSDAIRGESAVSTKDREPSSGAARRPWREGVTRAAARTPDDPVALITSAAERGLPDDPGALRAALGQAGDRIRLPLLLRIVERVREREGAEPAARRDEWRLARAAAHQALASRGSRLALYDLRETLESAKGRLPVEFLAPLALIGDRTCLEAIAAAHAAARDAWWRQHLADAFYTIVVREQLTARSPILKRVAKKWPGTWSAKARRNESKA
jgi:HEAT repeat protein